ncbi:MAG: hypothetical protein HON94_13335 [Methylococcales bacterium]|nr:hypothetical protein [Methylococcales bacterium]
MIVTSDVAVNDVFDNNGTATDSSDDIFQTRRILQTAELQTEKRVDFYTQQFFYVNFTVKW